MQHRTSEGITTGRTRRTLAITALLAAHGSLQRAPTIGAQEHPARFVAAAAGIRTAVRPGDTLTLDIAVSIPGGWHLYSITQPPGGPIATTFSVGPVGVASLAGAIGAPPPVIAPDNNFGILSEWYEDTAAFRIPIRVAPTLAAGRRTVLTRVRYQVCTARYCLPPTEDTLSVSLTVAGAAVSPPVLAQAPSAAAPANATLPAGTRTGSRAWLLFLWLAASMGAFSLLTPCVFPMVPITVSYFSNVGSRGRGSAVRDAALYALGIVGAFTGLGLGLSVVLGAAGLNRLAANPFLNLAVAALFVTLALSLFGVLHLRLPHGLIQALDRASSGGTAGRSMTTLLMGIAFAVTTLTCTAPFVGTLLVSAAGGGDWRWPAAGLFVFSSVFATPFLLLALMPRALGRLPRSGEWMTVVTATLGFVELAAAFKFVSNVDLVERWGIFTREAIIACWMVLGVLLTAYLFGVRVTSAQTPASPRAGVRVRRSAPWYVVASALAAVVTTVLGMGLTGRRLGELEAFLPPAGRGYTGVSGREAELPWIVDDYDGALRQAARERKLVLIDFTGYTCTNCRWMEANMFPRRDVARELSRFVRVRLFTDGTEPVNHRQQMLEQETFKTVALPLYAIVDSSGAPRVTFLGMTRDGREFVQFLSAGRAVQ